MPVFGLGNVCALKVCTSKMHTSLGQSTRLDCVAVVLHSCVVPVLDNERFKH